MNLITLSNENLVNVTKVAESANGLGTHAIHHHLIIPFLIQVCIFMKKVRDFDREIFFAESMVAFDVAHGLAPQKR